MREIQIGSRMLSSTGPNSIEIRNLTGDEANQLLAALRGLYWFKVENGRLKTIPSTLPLPDPVHDEEMLPFWREFSNTQSQVEMVEKIFEEMSDDVIYQPHIKIQYLCGYDYTPENYIKEAEKLLSYGFIQMRSKRDADGLYWEI